MKYLVCGCLIMIFKYSYCQYNTSLFYSNHFSSGVSQIQPSLVGEKVENFQIDFAQTHAWIGNNTLTYKEVKDYFQSSTITNEQVDGIINGLESVNLAGGGMEMYPLGVTIKIGGYDHELFTVAFYEEIKTGIAINYTKNLAKLLWKGNKQFAGQTVDLGPAAINWNINSENGFSFSMPLEIEFLGQQLKIRPGFRVKFIQSYGSIYMPKSDLKLTTSEDGRQLYMDADYDFNYALYGSNTKFNIGGLGNGEGLDLGLSTSFNEFLSASASVVDIGSIKYHDGVKNYRRNDRYPFTGIKVDIIDALKEGKVNVNPDTFEAVLQPVITEKYYKMPLGTKIILQGEFKFLRSITSTWEEREYFQGHLFFTYIQGFQNLPFTTKRPFFSFGYSHDFGGIINLGANTSFGGYNQLAFGGFFSLRMGFFRIGVGSSNLMPFLYKNLGTGVDFTFNTSLSF